MVVASIFRQEGATGIHTHVRQLRRYLHKIGVTSEAITPFSWGRLLTYPVFAPRPALAWINGPASVVWYRHWHEVFLRNALRRRLADSRNASSTHRGRWRPERLFARAEVHTSEW